MRSGVLINDKNGMARDSLRTVLRVLLAAAIVLAVVSPASAWAHDPDDQSHNPLGDVDFEQRLNAQVPLEITFRNEDGRAVQLADYFDGDRPVILVLGYFECPNLCSMVRRGVLDSLQKISLTVGKDFDVLAVSIDPEETPDVAAETKQQYVQAYAREGAADGWHFLTGGHGQIDRLAEAVGFRYAYDPAQGQYAHASGIVLLTPTGTVARYFYGLEYEPKNLRLGLIEAAENTIGSPIDRVLLFCYHYDPMTGTYSLLITRVLQLAGTATVLVLGGFLVVMLRQERSSEAGRA